MHGGYTDAGAEESFRAEDGPGMSKPEATLWLPNVRLGPRAGLQLAERRQKRFDARHHQGTGNQASNVIATRQRKKCGVVQLRRALLDFCEAWVRIPGEQKARHFHTRQHIRYGTAVLRHGAQREQIALPEAATHRRRQM